MRRAVDCSSLEPPVMAAGSVRLRRKTKGKFGICRILSLLGQIKRKLDRIWAGPAPKPSRRRKWVRVVGLTNSGGGWAHGSDQKSDAGLSSEPGHFLLLGLESGTGQKIPTGLFIEPDLLEVPSLVPSKGTLSSGAGGVPLSCWGVPAPSICEPPPSVCVCGSVIEDGKEKGFGASPGSEGAMLLSSVADVEPLSCLGVPASSVSQPSPSVCVCGSVAEVVGVKDSRDAGDGFGDGKGSIEVAKLLVPGFHFPSAEDFPAGFLSREWEDLFSSRPADRLGVSLKEVFAVPWEVDEPVSPSYRDNEVTPSRTEDFQVVCSSAPAKSLIRRGFFCPRAVSPTPVVLKEVLPVLKGKDPTSKEGSSSGATVLLSS